MDSPTPSSSSPINSSWGIFVNKAIEGFAGGLQDEDLLHENQTTELRLMGEKIGAFTSGVETLASNVETLKNAPPSFSLFTQVPGLMLQGKQLLTTGQTLATEAKKKVDEGMKFKKPLDQVRKTECNLLKSLLWMVLGKILTNFSTTKELGYSLIGSNVGKITALVIACKDNPTRQREVLAALRDSYLTKYLASKFAGSIRALVPPLKGKLETTSRTINETILTAQMFLPGIQLTILSALSHPVITQLVGTLVKDVAEQTKSVGSEKISDAAAAITELLKTARIGLDELDKLTHLIADCIEGKKDLKDVLEKVNELISKYTKKEREDVQNNLLSIDEVAKAAMQAPLTNACTNNSDMDNAGPDTQTHFADTSHDEVVLDVEVLTGQLQGAHAESLAEKLVTEQHSSSSPP